jgi:hypothetical protein
MKGAYNWNIVNATEHTEIKTKIQNNNTIYSTLRTPAECT